VSLSRAHVVIIALIAASVALGSAIVYWQPRWPLLAYWLAVAMILGMIISLTGSLSGIRSRAKWLITTFAILIGFALATTQLAARRTISTTHLTYHGVHLASVDSFTIGAGNVHADVLLQTITPSQVPWLLRLTRADSGWGIAGVQGVEQIRISRPGSSNARDFAVAHSGVLQNGGDMVVIVDPGGGLVDTLRLADGALRSSRGSTFSLETSNAALRRRYERRMGSGAPLSMLEGERAAADVYERFIRVQRIGPRDVVNGVPSSFVSRLLGRERLLVSATPPYRLAGSLVAHDLATRTERGSRRVDRVSAQSTSARYAAPGRCQLSARRGVWRDLAAAAATADCAYRARSRRLRSRTLRSARHTARKRSRLQRRAAARDVCNRTRAHAAGRRTGSRSVATARG
jgi:hypothetical protein